MLLYTQDNDQLPWLFLTSPQHDPDVYGYRSVILERHYPSFIDATITVHRISVSDETSFTTLRCLSADTDDDGCGDFHRRYRPYQRLVATPYDDLGGGRTPTDVEEAALRFARVDVQPIHRRLRGRSFGDFSTDNDL